MTDGGDGCGVVTDCGDGCDVVTDGGDGCDVVTDDSLLAYVTLLVTIFSITCGLQEIPT